MKNEIAFITARSWMSPDKLRELFANFPVQDHVDSKNPEKINS